MGDLPRELEQSAARMSWVLNPVTLMPAARAG